MGFLFDKERRDYYKAKKRDLAQKEKQRKVIKEDALYIKYYGMTAYLELFPEAKNFGTNWHRQVLEELIKIDKRNMANELSGISMAFAASNSKKAARSFKRVIKDMLK